MKGKQIPSDDILRQLVAARREEIVRVRDVRAEQLKDLETRGQAQLAALRKTLPKDMTAVLNKLDKAAKESSASKTRGKIKHGSSVAAGGHVHPQRPGFAGNKLVVAADCLGGWYLPDYSILYNADGSIFEQSEIPFNIDMGFSCWRRQFGAFRHRRGRRHRRDGLVVSLHRDRPMAVTITRSRFLFTEMYTLYADDGFWTSKEAHASINLSAQGWQFNFRDTATSNVMDVDSQNINDKGVFLPISHTMSYTDMLVAGEAFLRVSVAYYLYARWQRLLRGIQSSESRYFCLRAVAVRGIVSLRHGLSCPQKLVPDLTSACAPAVQCCDSAARPTFSPLPRTPPGAGLLK